MVAHDRESPSIGPAQTTVGTDCHTSSDHSFGMDHAFSLHLEKNPGTLPVGQLALCQKPLPNFGLGGGPELLSVAKLCLAKSAEVGQGAKSENISTNARRDIDMMILMLGCNPCTNFEHGLS